MTFADDGQPIAGQWEYTGAGVVDFWIVKAGTEYAVHDFRTAAMQNIGLWSLHDFAGGGSAASHFTAYRAAVQVPEPTSVLLLLMGFAGAGLCARRRL